MFGLKKIALTILALAVYGCADMAAKSGGEELSPPQSAAFPEGTPCASFEGQPKAVEACLNAFHQSLVSRARFAGHTSDKYDPCEEFSFYAPAFEACAAEFKKRIITEAEAIGAGGFMIPQKPTRYPSHYGK